MSEPAPQTDWLAPLPHMVVPTVAAALRENIPGHEQELYLPLKIKQKQGIEAKLHAMALIEFFLAQGLTQKAAIVETVKRKKGYPGCTNSTLTKLYTVWKNGGQKQNAHGVPSGSHFEPRDWKLFIPNYRNDKPGQPEEFIDYVAALHGDSNRNDAFLATHERLKDNWRRGEHIPGYGNIYDWCQLNGRVVPEGPILRKTDYPEGWSADNLRKLINKKRPAMLAVIRKGEYQAHEHWADQLLRDRSKLRPMELMTVDDVRFDIKVWMHVDGVPQVVYPQGIFVICVGTGRILKYGVSARATRLQDEGGSKAGTKRGLSMTDTKFLLLKLLEELGLPQWKCRFLLENATASLAGAEKEAFTRILPGRLEFETTGMIRNKVLKSGFAQEGGMPWQKGWIESLFHILHTRMNHLPGSTGSRYALNPGDLESKAAYTLKMLKAAHKGGIDPSELQLPILSKKQFEDLLARIVDSLNWRDNHRLQGFKRIHECEYEPGKYIDVNDSRASGLIPVGATLMDRMETPEERWIRLMDGATLDRPNPIELLPLYLDKRTVKIRNGKIQFRDKKFSSDLLVYRDRDSAPMLEENEGRELLAFVRDDRNLIHLTDEDYGYVGSVSRQGAIDLVDTDALERASHRVSNARHAVRREARELMSDREKELKQMHTANDRLLLGDKMAKAEERDTVNRIEHSNTTAKASPERQNAILEDLTASETDFGYEAPTEAGDGYDPLDDL